MSSKYSETKKKARRLLRELYTMVDTPPVLHHRRLERPVGEAIESLERVLQVIEDEDEG